MNKCPTMMCLPLVRDTAPGEYAGKTNRLARWVNRLGQVGKRSVCKPTDLLAVSMNLDYHSRSSFEGLRTHVTLMLPHPPPHTHTFNADTSEDAS